MQKSMFHTTTATVAIPVCLLLLLFHGQAAAEPWTVELELRGEQLHGLPLRWSDTQVVLLGRDGKVWRFARDEATNYRKVRGKFQGYSYTEMRGTLLREFNRGFELSTTSHYFVVHPPHQSKRWTKRFEALYRSFLQYFAVRGIKVHDPIVPLVAVVFPNKAMYLDYAARTEKGISAQTLGYYSITSNRIIMYDIFDEQGSEFRWQTNAATIVHEAVHQVAFNTGVHDRASIPPRWVAEGLGTMFESKGVWDSSSFPRQKDRLHSGYLRRFKQARANRPDGMMAEIIASDRIFGQRTNIAYAEAWAMTFFLAETQPKQYAEYLQRTTSRRRSLNPSAKERLKEFTDVFGPDLRLLESHYKSYIDRLHNLAKK
jgi:hypothetical protein